jgi:hypothetical protein
MAIGVVRQLFMGESRRLSVPAHRAGPQWWWCDIG